MLRASDGTQDRKHSLQRCRGLYKGSTHFLNQQCILRIGADRSHRSSLIPLVHRHPNDTLRVPNGLDERCSSAVVLGP
jgi:hypothetical protein